MAAEKSAPESVNECQSLSGEIWPGLRGEVDCGAGGVQPPLSCVIISMPDDSRRTENGIFWERFQVMPPRDPFYKVQPVKVFLCQLLMVPRCPANVNVPRGTQIIIMLNSDTALMEAPMH